MHVASSPHDLQSLPRFQNSRALLPIFVMHDIQTTGALVPQPTDNTLSIWPQRPRTKKRKATLDNVLSAVERGFAAVANDITDIKSKMATKDDIADVHRKVATKGDLAETRLDRRIEKLDTKLTKFEDREIDKRLQLEVRVSAIEKRLGLNKKIAA
jgi:hypothetical protein